MKVDIVTRNNRSFLAVNIQLMHDMKLTIRTLGIVELLTKLTGANSALEIFKILNAYNIDLSYIYFFTFDNVTNMVKLCNLLNEEKNEYDYQCNEFVEVLIADCETNDIITDNGENDNDDKEREDLEDESFSIEDTELDHSISDPYNNHTNDEGKNCFLNLREGEQTKLESNDLPITHVRCAAHTLQLVVEDALKRSHILKAIKKARAAIKHLRVPSTMEKNLHLSPGKRPTRWHSTYDTLVSLLNYSDFSTYVEKYVDAND